MTPINTYAIPPTPAPTPRFSASARPFPVIRIVARLTRPIPAPDHVTRRDA